MNAHSSPMSTCWRWMPSMWVWIGAPFELFRLALVNSTSAANPWSDVDISNRGRVPLSVSSY